MYRANVRAGSFMTSSLPVVSLGELQPAEGFHVGILVPDRQGHGCPVRLVRCSTNKSVRFGGGYLNCLASYADVAGTNITETSE